MMRRISLVLVFIFLAMHRAGAQGLQSLIIGGGPDIESNQAAIESNVRYVTRLLPPASRRTVLFADGKPKNPTVVYSRDPASLPVERRLLFLLLSDEENEAPGEDMGGLRIPHIAHIDGASSQQTIRRAFGALSRAARPTLLYFTGHGSPDDVDGTNNTYELWHNSLSVRQLARQIARLPQKTPVTLIMVQCYSGAFGNVLFEDGNAQGKLIARDFAGFFAATRDRMAAGCTSEVNEAEYRDFTSYFFAALSGRDRVGRRVSGVDYNRDGRVGMNEAFAYTLLADASIDVPTCTSDVFLRRFVAMPDAEILATPYASLQAWATPAQRAALDGLSQKLGLTGEKRLATAQQKAASASGDGMGQWLQSISYKRASNRYDELWNAGRDALLKKWPTLNNEHAPGYAAARKAALAQLAAQAKRGDWKEFLKAGRIQDEYQTRGEADEVRHAQILRFARLGKSLVLAHRLRSGQNTPLKARFEQLLISEGRTPFSPQSS